MKILTVIPLQKNTFTEELTYFSSTEIPLGSIVTITIRNKKMLGLVISFVDANEMKSEIKNMDFNIKKVVETKEFSIFRDEFIESALVTSKYFVTNKSSTISYLIPQIIKESYDKIAKSYTKERKENDIINKNITTEKLLFQAPTEERLSYYKTLIRTSFANKKSIFIVLPTSHDIEYWENNLQKGIENFIFSLHSGVSTKKLLAKIEKIVNEEHAILIIGTAQYVSIPRNDIETIIIEHESSTSYKTLMKPYFDLRTFIEIYASKTYSKIIFADTLLRFETIARRELENINELQSLSFRINFEGEIKILERKKDETQKEVSKKKWNILSEESIKEIGLTLAENKNVFVFSLRKGLATYTVCRSCNTEVSCDSCQAPLVLYTANKGEKRIFSCNKCKIEKDPLITCTNCNSWDLVSLGIGTDTVIEELTSLFPTTKILKLDKESAKTNSGAEKIVKEFERNKGSILVGTEMALFYIKEKVDLSLIASFDGLWTIPHFKMSEKILQIILGVINKTENTFIIETKNVQDDIIRSVQNKNLLSYVREELQDRKILEYPPYKRFIKISYNGDKEETKKVKDFLTEYLKEYNPTIFGGFISKSNNQYITNTLLKLEKKDWSLPSLSLEGHLNEKLSKKLSDLPETFNIQIDPEDLL
jgi:primosomal protein N' (replication factor Y)